MNKEWLEGLLADAISHIKASLDEVNRNHHEQFKKQLDQIKATYFIAKHDTTVCLETIKNNHKDTINKRHSAVISIFRTYEKILIDDSVNVLYAKNMGNQRIIKFIRETIRFLEISHQVFHCDTPKDIREKMVKEYIGDTNE